MPLLAFQMLEKKIERRIRLLERKSGLRFLDEVAFIRHWIDKPLSMGFCLDCHRDPAPNLRPADHITDMAWQPPADARAKGEAIATHEGIRFGELTHCYVCHR